MATRLLPPDALKGIPLALSVSDSPDLGKLGLLESHFRMALGEIGRCVLIAGGRLVYGGHLHPSGYAAFLARELERYGQRNRPLLLCLAWSEHRKLPLSVIEGRRKSLGLLGELVCLDAEGREVDPGAGRNEAAPGPVDAQTESVSLSGLRRYMTARSAGRILIGGKREGFQGAMPGVLEEAIVAVKARQPIYIAGGFGGVAWNIASAAGFGPPDLLPFLANETPDRRLVSGLVALKGALQYTKSASLSNGLTDDENRQLAAAYRPSEVAALVSLGLARKFQT
jgi:hypothetical protein